MEQAVSFGEWVQRRRKALDLTQKVLAHQVGCALITLKKIEQDERKPSHQIAERLAAALAVPLTEQKAFVQTARGQRPPTRLTSPEQVAPQRPPVKPVQPRAHLPTYLTSFVGRKGQMAQLTQRTQTTRLLTLTGPGGAGKTRLAIEVAQAVSEPDLQVQPPFPHGIWWVDLTSLTDPTLAPQAVLNLFKLPEQAGRPVLERLTHYLADKQLLLLLDNCEHLIQACAELVERLLQACPYLHLLVTSREPLRVPSETIWQVPPLMTPDPKQVITLEQLLDYEAIHLFIERAGRLNPHFSLHPPDVRAIAQICYALDGLPLALELASAQVTALSVEEVAARLTQPAALQSDTTSHLLTQGMRTAPFRHQSLHGALAWSYALLTPPEQVLLARLAVFAGGWTAEAVEVVCGETARTDPVPQSKAVLPLLLQLVHKSLVVAEPKNGQTRYRFLETIRQFAQAKLHERNQSLPDEIERLCERHLHHFLALAEEGTSRGLLGRAQSAWFQQLESEQANLRVAFVWSQTQVETVELGLRLAASLWPYWHSRGAISEGQSWLQPALIHNPAVAPNVRAKALYGLSMLLWNHGDIQQAAALAEESLALCTQVNDPSGMAYTLLPLANAATANLDHAQAVVLGEESLALFRHIHDAYGISHALLFLVDVLIEHNEFGRAAFICEECLQLGQQVGENNLIYYGLFRLAQVDQVHAKALCEQELARQRMLGDPAGTAATLQAYGRLLLNEGEYEQARTHLTECLALWQALEVKWSQAGGIARAALDLGRAAWLLNDYATANSYFEQSGRLYGEVLDLDGVAHARHYAGHVAVAERNYPRAVAYFKESLQLWQTVGFVNYTMLALAALGEVAHRQGDLQQAARLYGVAANFNDLVVASVSAVERIGHERIMADAQAQLTNPIFATAWNAGQKMTLPQAIEEALTIAAHSANRARAMSPI